MRIIIAVFLWSLIAINPAYAEKLLLELKGGVVEIQLLPEKAPKHVARITE
jgi:hypothetical protein